ncbi:MAG: Membrane protein [Nitrospira sp.]|nr:MAG: Membrane protein [Nitrospira sp.]
MREFHSWSGILFGWLLYAVFLTGTLTVFDAEITQWMQPELAELTLRESNISQAGNAPTAQPPQSHRDIQRGLPPPSVHTVKLQTNRTFGGQTTDPRTGRMVVLRDTQGGDFFYHFHHGLLLGYPGAWIVGLAGLSMIVSLITGMGIHRRSMKGLVLGSLGTSSNRAGVSHNLLGLLVLPFALLISVTGLLISSSIYLPIELQLLRDKPSTLSFLSTLHFVQFGTVAMRWLYFLMGLATSATIATGLVLWTIKRRPIEFAQARLTSAHIIERLNIATVAGLLVSVAALFWLNRILPLPLFERAVWEIRGFFLIWCVSLIHSLLRRNLLVSWQEQLSAAALLLAFLPGVNALTTDSHLLITLSRGQWAMAGVDLTSLAVGVLLGVLARRVGRSGGISVKGVRRESQPV